MSYYDVISKPPRSYEAIRAITAILEADSELTDALGGAGRIYSQRVPRNLPDDPVQWRRCVAREPVVIGGIREVQGRIMRLTVQVMFEIEEGSDIDVDVFLQAAHDRALVLLEGQSPALATGAWMLRLERTRRPLAAAFDADTDSYYSTAEYLAVLQPN